MTFQRETILYKTVSRREAREIEEELRHVFCTQLTLVSFLTSYDFQNIVRCRLALEARKSHWVWTLRVTLHRS